MAGGRIFLHGCRKNSAEPYKKNIRVGSNRISLHVAYTRALKHFLDVKSFQRFGLGLQGLHGCQFMIEVYVQNAVCDPNDPGPTTIHQYLPVPTSMGI